MNYLSNLKTQMDKCKYLSTKGVLLLIFLCSSIIGNTQLVFSETFDELNNSTTGTDNTSGVNWSTSCPTCLDAGDFFYVDSGELVGQDSNGPATWETGLIDISSCSFIDISLLLREEGTMEACGTGCTSVDWVQLEYNIDNTGWQTPSNSTFCGGNCAGINVIQSDDITGTSLDYSTGCIASGTTLQLRIVIQAWAASERWYIDDVEVSCSTGPSIDAGLDQNICGGDAILTASNPDNGVLNWNNGVTDGVAFTPTVIGLNTYVVSSELGGCVATDTVLITVNEQPNFSLNSANPTICSGTDGSISFTGLSALTNYEITYNDGGASQGPNTLTANSLGVIELSSLSAGNYSNFVVSIDGCQSTDNSIITLVDPASPSIDAGSNQLGCAGTEITLTALNPDNANISWDHGITDGVPFSPILGTTTYTVTAALNGCVSTDFVDITVNQLPQINANNDLVICEGTQITLTAINPDFSTISWNNNVVDGVAFNPAVGTTTYTVTGNLNGCESAHDVIVVVNEAPNFTIDVTNPTTCLGSDGIITLSGLLNSTDYQFSYNDGGNQITNTITSNMNGHIIIDGLISGGYTDFIVELQGCTGIDNTQINLVDPTPPTIDAGNDQVLCEGTSVILTAVNPDNAILSWTNNVENGNPFTQDLGVIPYTVTANLNECISTDQVQVTVVSAPLIDAGVDQFICIGDSVKLEAINLNGGLIEWSNSIQDGISFTPQTSQTYVVSSTIGACSSEDEVDVIVSQGPDAAFSFNPNNPSIENTEVSFNIVASDFDSEHYSWNFGDGHFSTLNSPIHFYPEVGGITYEVNLLVIDSTGCRDSSSTIITVDDILLYYVPNAFTPDGDKVNNTFQPVFTSGFDIYDYHLIMFNRWGEVIFESYDAEIGWDGTYLDGSLADSGVYVWTIEFGEIKSDKRNIKQGHVTLIK